MAIKLFETVKDEAYEGGAFTLKREYEGLTPNGNPFGGRWVLRSAGALMCFDSYRNDIAEWYDLELIGLPRTK